ncbi:MAG TPA: cytochrome c [Thermodesulfobacteriota bacterium]|nr:cytochrome c [Thermodesulfobacteriota bacterium]
MKRFLVTAALALAVPAAAGAADMTKMHEMMMKMGGPKPETRTEMKIPEPMKVMQKGMMRQHFDTLSEITGALAANDLKKAAELASSIGWTPEEKTRCETISEAAGQKELLTLGMAVHKKADELAESARAGDRDKALVNLSQLMKNCNSCHERFRH